MTDLRADLAARVARFQAEAAKLTASGSGFTETEARVEFIDPLFLALGWDVSNGNGLPNRLKDVVREESRVIEQSTKRPDYTFRIVGQRKFFVEAKKPAVDITKSKESAFQVRRYGWSAGLPISVLTNFKTLRIYDTRTLPDAGDHADVGLVAEFSCAEMITRIDELSELLSRDAVAAGSIEARFAVPPTTIPVNEIFLGRINAWRLMIAADLHDRYPALSLPELSDIAQNLINKLIFLRMCEDRGIEAEGRLREVAGKRDLVELRRLLKQLDERYNTGLFNVSKDALQTRCSIDAQLFLEVVEELYFPKAPYDFSVLDADFLGQVYELFLVQRLVADGSGGLLLKEKPAYEDRDIVITPQPIVDELVRRTVGNLLAHRRDGVSCNFDTLKQLRIMDIAVGSSRFLIRVFDELVDEAIAHYKGVGDATAIYQRAPGDYRLRFEAKRELLIKCLYGIDIDFNAVEVARFSLIVKLLEEEDGTSLPTGRSILPDLDKNILWGNSVVDSAFTHADVTVMDATRPLDWTSEFGFATFDAVVGNPPYVKTEEMKEKTPHDMEYYKTSYETPYKQFDKYFVFIERAIRALADGGWTGMVLSNKWITIESGSKLRKLLVENNLVADIVDFGNERIFAGKSTYVCLLVLAKRPKTQFHYRNVTSYATWLPSASDPGFKLDAALLTQYGKDSWILPADENEAKVLTHLFTGSDALGKLASVYNGIQTSAEDVYPIYKWKTLPKGLIEFTDKSGRAWKIEQAITKPYLSDSRSLVKSYKSVKNDCLIVFPYSFNSAGEAILIDPAQMLARFPLTLAYLTNFRPRLLKRDISPPLATPDEFYRYGRHQSLSKAFDTPKIVLSVNQLGDKYGYDSIGVGIASGGTAGEIAIANPKDGYSLEFLLGLLHQRAIEFYCRKRGSPFGGGYYSRGTAVISKVPVPRLDFGRPDHLKAHQDITLNVRSVISNNDKRSVAVGRDVAKLDKAIAAAHARIKSVFDTLFKFDGADNALKLPGEA